MTTCKEHIRTHLLNSDDKLDLVEREVCRLFLKDKTSICKLFQVKYCPITPFPDKLLRILVFVGPQEGPLFRYMEFLQNIPSPEGYEENVDQ